MLISSLFVRHQTPQPRFAPGLFLLLLAIFVFIGQSKPALALAGIGTTLIVAATLVEVNRNRIWELYKKTHKRKSSLSSFWTKPNPMYYNLNVFFLWPFILFLGLVCLWSAYLVS